MQITPNVLMNTLLQNLGTQEQRLAQLQNEASTGQLFQVPSDNPSAVTATMGLNTGLDQVTTYQTNVNAAQGPLNAASGALQNAQALWQNVLSVAVQASNSTNNSNDRLSLANTVWEAQKTLGQIWNTQYEGRYIFAGYQDTTPPVNTNSTSLSSWPGSPGTGQKVFQIGTNSFVTVNLTGYEAVGQPSGQSYFQILYNDLGTLAQNIMAGPSATSAMLTTLQNDQSYISNAQSLLGARMQRVSQTGQNLGTLAFDLNKSISQTAGADMTKVALQLAQEEQAYQAALKSGAQVLPLSLLNFINP